MHFSCVQAALFFKACSPGALCIGSMADASAISVAATRAAAVSEGDVATEHGSEDNALSSACSSSSQGDGSASTGSSLLDQIHKLKADQAALKTAKAKLAKDMKNAVKRKKRLQSRAVQLSDTDLCDFSVYHHVHHKMGRPILAGDSFALPTL